MKILLVNKFLYPKGGSETYLLNLGERLSQAGHEVQYFGMDHDERIVGNNVHAYTSNMDFHDGSKLEKLFYPIKTIYSFEARKKIRKVLDDFQPDVCHLNNFNYQLTPSIILEIVKWRKQTGRKCKIVYTAHDLQLVCPNHLMLNLKDESVCEKCLHGNYVNCIKGKCIHGSLAKSVVGASEAYFWKARGVYKYIDIVISPSFFLAEKLTNYHDLKNKIKVMHNFVNVYQPQKNDKEDYVLYFGRYSKEKGVKTLLQATDNLPQIRFVFAGSGPMEAEINSRKNIVNKGFLSGEELKKLISNALFSVVPSECYENCPFTVIESQLYGTPVLGANIGGIPELISENKTGELFESGNAVQLENMIRNLMSDTEKLNRYSDNCLCKNFDSADKYCEELVKLYL